MTDPIAVLIVSPWLILPLLRVLFPERPRSVGDGWQGVRRDLMDIRRRGAV